MAKPKFPYVGDAAMRRFLKLHNCPTPFHVARMRFWGEIVSPSLNVSPVKTISSLWPDGLPTFENGDEANRFFQTLMGLWNRMARHQDASSPVRLQTVESPSTRDALREAAAMRVEELYDGFMHGFTGGNREMDVPSGVAELLARIEKGIELLATARNTFARPPGPDDAGMLDELARVFPVVDHAVQADLNAIAVAVKQWRKTQMAGGLSRPSAKAGPLH
ncbi:hypothetical protein [Pseudorhodoplanes sp.]|uniref:hypothetical protein n=1 Tax=Pseudorhodoplanes sp. TaxID=1934341 RepID=UPI003918A740